MSITTLGGPCQGSFVAFGERYGLRADDAALLDRLIARLPLGWHRSSTEPSEVSTWYTLGLSGSTSVYRLSAADETLLESLDLGVVLDAFERHAELAAAERARDSLFVHAGVVAWRHQALVIPGTSGSGKTSLVRAFLAAGATYLSDEYARLDRDGNVHPYPRPLSVRGADRGREAVTAGSLGAPTSPTAVPVRAILSTWYQPGAVWEPRRLSGARALVALMQHTVAARRDPTSSMPILKAAVSRSFAFESPRAEADVVVREVLSNSTIF